jgi:lipopolysaccharide/colanic/teichoic acid biosynthesis glycosyltransferase
MSTEELRYDLLGQRPLFGSYGISAAARPASRSLLWKFIFDRSIALFLLIPALPLIGLLIVAVRLTSRGPGLYRQVRVGKFCRRFLMYKIRTMHVDAEANTGPVWAALGADPRTTALGHWLRRSHLDELPQLFNVLKGEMSLIGPRPERPDFVALLADKIPGYTERVRVLPGITGLAQVNLPPDSDLDSVRRKLVLDREYVESANLGLDLRILLCTVLRVIGLRGELAVRLFGLQRTVAIAPTKQPTDACSNQLPTPQAICSAAPRDRAEPTRERCVVAAPRECTQAIATNDAVASNSSVNRDCEVACAD